MRVEPGRGGKPHKSKSPVCLASQADVASCAPAVSHANYSVYPAACLRRRPALPGSERPQRKGGDSSPANSIHNIYSKRASLAAVYRVSSLIKTSSFNFKTFPLHGVPRSTHHYPPNNSATLSRKGFINVHTHYTPDLYGITCSPACPLGMTLASPKKRWDHMTTGRWLNQISKPNYPSPTWRESRDPPKFHTWIPN